MVCTEQYIPLNFNHFCERTHQFGSLEDTELTKDFFKQLLKEKIAKTSIEMVKSDVRPFIRNHNDMEIWSAEYFSQLVDMIRFE
jgi:hypothetical protein